MVVPVSSSTSIFLVLRVVVVPDLLTLVVLLRKLGILGKKVCQPNKHKTLVPCTTEGAAGPGFSIHYIHQKLGGSTTHDDAALTTTDAWRGAARGTGARPAKNDVEWIS